MKQIIVFTTIIISFLFFATKVFASSVVINEFMPHPSSGNDWIEIYNPTSSIIDLTNWTLVDSASTMKTLSDNISPFGFAALEVSNRLNNPGDSIYLKDSNGNIIDNYSYNSDPGIDISFGRSPDGAGWINLASSSKGSSNGEITTPTPSPTPTPTPSPNATKPTSIFTISNIPSQIDSDQSFSVSVNLSLPENPNTNFYLKGAFKKSDSSNYFGQTKVSGSWVKNGESYSSQLPVITNNSGVWSGTLEIKPDSEDSGFIGTGDYIFKIGKYNAADTSPSVVWSDNESTIKIVFVDTPSPSASTSSLAPTSTAAPTSKPRTIPSPTINRPIHIASVAGVMTTASASATASSSSATVEIKDQRQTNPLVWIGLVFVFAGVGTLGYIYIKKNAKLHLWFRR